MEGRGALYIDFKANQFPALYHPISERMSRNGRGPDVSAGGSKAKERVKE